MRTSTRLNMNAVHNLRRASSKRPVKIGIRPEDPKRIWERRAPLTPDAVYELVAEGRASVEVVSSPKRIFTDQEYRKAGATIVPALTDPDIILGIKEPPLSSFTPPPSPSPSSPPTLADLRHLPWTPSALAAARESETERDRDRGRGRRRETTHMMFSHTIKGQEYNMPLLAQYVAPSSAAASAASGSSIAGGARVYPRLIDYELITGDDGKRTVGFGWFAGVAGVLESLSAMAQAHLELGIASPFLYTPRPHTLPSLDRLRAALREIGQTVAAQGTPPQLGPFVVGLTGMGQVAQGCLSMLAELPIEMVRVEDLDALMRRGKSSEVDLRKIYLVHAKPEDYLVRVDGAKYDRAHYYQSPQSYTSVFCDKVAPYLTLFLNGTGWSPSFPRLMTTKQLEVALSRAQGFGGARFTNIGDISCDVEGGLEFLDKATTLSAPTTTVRTVQAALPPVRMMAVDILPASVPYDASVHFAAALLKGGQFKELVAYHAGERADVPEALRRATVAVHGRLAEGHGWLMEGVDRAYEAKGKSKELVQSAGAGETKAVNGAATAPATATATATAIPPRSFGKKRILILGSGMVAAPAVDLIAQSAEFDLVVAGDSAVELERLVAPHHHVNYRIVDAADSRTYATLVEDADVVISLLPVAFHVAVAETCLDANTHLITASYMTEAMEKLDQRAAKKGLLFLTEIGLDPGIDHCSAMELLDKFKRQGKHVLSFASFCGGLPLPENAHVPLGYKFSWRPQGVLTAALNGATYLLGNQVRKVPGDRLLQSYWPDVPITSQFKLEGLPNRDSLAYKKHYQIYTHDMENKARTIVRGTLRYPGFSTLMSAFAALGLLNTTHRIHLTAWPDLVAQCLRIKREQGHDTALAALVPPEHVDALREALEWLGLARPSMLTGGGGGGGAAGGGQTPMPPVPGSVMTPLDIFAFLLAQKLRYAKGERDMVVLAHEIITRGPAPKHGGGGGAQGPVEVHTSTLIQEGVLEHGGAARGLGLRPASAMARTVGLPAAIAAMLVAEGGIPTGSSSSHSPHGGESVVGVHRPTLPSIYKPIMSRLRRVGIEMEERTVVRHGHGVRTVEDALYAGGGAAGVGAGAGVGGGARGVDLSMVPPRDLDGDRNWTEEDGLVVDPRKQY